MKKLTLLLITCLTLACFATGCSKSSQNQNESSDVSKLNQSERIIVSLTSYPKRFEVMTKTLKSLCNQTIKPDIIVVNLSEEENENKSLITDVLKENNLQDKITINWYKGNIKSYLKLIPALEKYPEDIIITVDDDRDYPENLVEELIAEHKMYPKCIISSVCDGLSKNCSLMGNTADKYVPKHKPVNNAIILGFSGVLYPSHCFNNDVLDKEWFLKDYPTDDDIFFTLCAIISNTKIVKLYDRSEESQVRPDLCFDYDIPRLWDENSLGKTNSNLVKLKNELKARKIQIDYIES